MSTGSLLAAGLVGKIVGTGPGRGIGLLFVPSGPLYDDRECRGLGQSAHPSRGDGAGGR